MVDGNNGSNETSEQLDLDAGRLSRATGGRALETDRVAPSEAQSPTDPDLGDAVIGMYFIG